MLDLGSLGSKVIGVTALLIILANALWVVYTF